MIPTMILFGLLLGRWWKTALVVGTAAWPALLLADGVIGTPAGVVGAAGLALINTAVGIAVHQGVLALLRAARSHRRRGRRRPRHGQPPDRRRPARSRACLQDLIQRLPAIDRRLPTRP